MSKWLLPLCLLLAIKPSAAQGRLLLEEAQARKNLIASPPPVVPASVHATGKVVLLVQIGPDGRVTGARPDTGPSILREPAVNAVNKWRFKPFLVHEQKVAASTKLTVEFGATPPPAAVAAAKPEPPAQADPALQQFQVLEAKCRSLVTAQADPAQEAEACRAAADQAGTLTGANRFLLERSADVFAATALMRTDDLKLAIAYGSKAIQVVAEGHDDASGASAAYAVRGQAKAFAGDLPGADLDLSKAEGFERRALTAAAGTPAEAESHAAMKSLLLFHAQLLNALKQPDKAAAKTAEAGKL